MTNNSPQTTEIPKEQTSSDKKFEHQLTVLANNPTDFDFVVSQLGDRPHEIRQIGMMFAVFVDDKDIDFQIEGGH